MIHSYLLRPLLAFAIVIACIAWGSCAIAQQEGEASAEETAKALANPAGSLANLANNITFKTFKGDLRGADSQDTVTYTFRPVIQNPLLKWFQ